MAHIITTQVKVSKHTVFLLLPKVTSLCQRAKHKYFPINSLLRTSIQASSRQPKRFLGRHLKSAGLILSLSFSLSYSFFRRTLSISPTLSLCLGFALCPLLSLSPVLAPRPVSHFLSCPEASLSRVRSSWCDVRLRTRRGQEFVSLAYK